METIPKDRCLKTGYLKKTHGTEGAILMAFDSRFAASFDKEPPLLLEIDGLLVPWFPKPQGITLRTSESALVKLQWIDDEHRARQLCGISVYIREDDYQVDDDHHSDSYLEGYTLFDSGIGQIGIVEEIMDYGGNILIRTTYNGKEVLVPFNEDLVAGFDEKNKTITLNCPAGIFDLS